MCLSAYHIKWLQASLGTVRTTDAMVIGLCTALESPVKEREPDVSSVRNRAGAWSTLHSLVLPCTVIWLAFPLLLCWLTGKCWEDESLTLKRHFEQWHDYEVITYLFEPWIIYFYAFLCNSLLLNCKPDQFTYIVKLNLCTLHKGCFWTVFKWI